MWALYGHRQSGKLANNSNQLAPFTCSMCLPVCYYVTARSYRLQWRLGMLLIFENRLSDAKRWLRRRRGRFSVTCTIIYTVGGVENAWVQLTTHSSTPRGWMFELAMLADIQRTVYPEEVTRQLHVMVQARESSPVIDRRSNHCATPSTAYITSHFSLNTSGPDRGHANHVNIFSFASSLHSENTYSFLEQHQNTKWNKN